MKKNITPRMAEYLTLAKSITFDKKELTILRDIIKAIVLSETEGGDLWEPFQDMYDALHSCLKNGSYHDTYNEDESCDEGVTSDTRYVDLNFLQYALVNCKRVFFFIALVPIARVPIYMNDPILEPFVKWRLTIAK